MFSDLILNSNPSGKLCLKMTLVMPWRTIKNCRELYSGQIWMVVKFSRQTGKLLGFLSSVLLSAIFETEILQPFKF